MIRRAQFQLLWPPLGLAGLAWLGAAAVLMLTDLRLGSVVPAYFRTAMAGLVLTVLLVLFHLTIRCMIRRVDNPYRVYWRHFRNRAHLLLIPALVFPAFMIAYTVCKKAIPIFVGFGWDRDFILIDRLIVGQDPWRLTHAVIGGAGSEMLELIYVWWGAPLVFSFWALAFYGRRRTMALFATSMLMTWLAGGLICAFLLSSSGPVFAGHFDPGLKSAFAELDRTLRDKISPDGPILLTQRYLLAGIGSDIVGRGDGISAMPSMHVATTCIYALVARGTIWFWPAVAFTLLIWLGSVHFGYHYAVDGLLSLAIAICCYALADRLYEWQRASVVTRA